MPWFEIARVVAHVLLWTWAALGVVMVIIYFIHLWTKRRRQRHRRPVVRYRDGTIVRGTPER